MAQGEAGARAHHGQGGEGRRERLAAIDLGTNNCRLLIAAPRGRSFRIVDAFSRIVRLGEGLSQTGNLSDAAIERTIDALSICAQKMKARGVTRARAIATQACRAARNGEAFIARVAAETGLDLEIIDTREEARLAVAGCSELVAAEARAALIFDIGGGSTELSWVTREPGEAALRIKAWTSLPLGVVTLSEAYGGADLTPRDYERMIEDVGARLFREAGPEALKPLFVDGKAHALGTSGTVTSLAGVHLGLPRYRRDKVDGLWLSDESARAISRRLLAMTNRERAGEPCIGPERADLVLCGCAILEAILREWPSRRIRVADRGLREGVLTDLAREARKARLRKRRRRRR